VERDEDLTAPYAFQNSTWIAFEDKISVGIKVFAITFPSLCERSLLISLFRSQEISDSVFSLFGLYENSRCPLSS